MQTFNKMKNNLVDLREMLRNWDDTYFRVKTHNPELRPEEVYEIVSRMMDDSLGIKGGAK